MEFAIQIPPIARRRNRKPVSAAWFVALAGLWLLANSAPAAPAREALDRPNVVLILADNLGWGDLAHQGNPSVETPAMDALAKAGTHLERFYVSPASAPTRAVLLTGRHFLLNGVTADTGGAQHLHEAEITVAEMLQARGYHTGYFGKWQNGANYPHTPMGQGFDRFTGYCQSGQSLEEGAEIWQDLDATASPLPVAETVLQAAQQFLRDSAAEPFLLVLASPYPASPVPENSPQLAKFEAQELSPQLAQVYAAIETLDAEVAALITELAKLELTDHTVVMVTSDGGPEPVEGRYQDRLYGGKGSLHEGGLRVPCLLSWPGVIEADTRIGEVTQHIDIVPTLAALTGAELPTDRWMDGLDLTPLLLFGEVDRWPNRNLNFAWIPGKNLDQARCGLRTTRWRAVKDPDWRRGDWDDREEQWELYDMTADPYQDYDQAELYPFVLAKLKSDYIQWFRRATVFGYADVPNEIGHEEWPVVRLLPESALLSPADDDLQDGDALAGWNKEGFTATWPLKVVRDSTVEVLVEYRTSKPARTILALANEAPRELVLEPSDQWNSLTFGEFQLPKMEMSAVLRTSEPVEGLEVRQLILKRTKGR